MPPWQNVSQATHQCLVCGMDFLSKRGTAKYCTSSCSNKARYTREGQRYSTEQQSEWYRARMTCANYQEKLRKQGRSRYRQVQEFLREFKLERGCADCGYAIHHAALEFDHVSGEKEINVCNAKSIRQARNEISKCEVVCANCHGIRTFERLQSKPDIFEATYEPVPDDA